MASGWAGKGVISPLLKAVTGLENKEDCARVGSFQSLKFEFRTDFPSDDLFEASVCPSRCWQLRWRYGILIRRSNKLYNIGLIFT